MNIENLRSTLENNHQEVTVITPNLVRATQSYRDKPFAVRYFDLSNNIYAHSERLNEYLDEVLSEDFFDVERPIDLRWNNYLYFITSDDTDENTEYFRAKNAIESNKEYARKFVVKESELARVLKLSRNTNTSNADEEKDIYATWVKILNDKNIGYLMDFDLSISKAVKKIASNETGKLESVSIISQLNNSERIAIKKPLDKLIKQGFRNFPQENEFSFGSHVNLITGPNGHGKTSLLEAIEYLYCGSTKRNDTNIFTQITGLFKGEEVVLQTGSEKKYAKQLKTRNLNWYGKNDLRGSTLDDSFARFNFMDTDAAVRVSIDSSSKSLSEDISRIILGAEAGKASDRVTRLEAALEKEYFSSIRGAEKHRVSLGLLEDEKNSIASYTTQSDVYKERLISYLNDFGWKQSLDISDVISAESLANDFSIVKNKCKLIENTNIATLEHDLELNINKEKEFASLCEKQSGFKLELSQLQTKKNLIINQISGLNELKRYRGLALQELDELRKKQSIELDSLRRKLSIVGDKTFGDFEFKDAKLSTCISSLDFEVDEYTNSISQIKTEIAKHEHSQKVVDNLKNKLLSTAKHILESTKEHSNCPLCETAFEEGELVKAIFEKNQQESHSMVGDAHDRLEKLVQDKLILQDKSQSLRLLDRYCSDLIDITIENAILLVQSDRNKFEQLNSELENTLSRLSDCAQEGLTVAKLKELTLKYETRNLDDTDIDVKFNLLNDELEIAEKGINSKLADLSETESSLDNFISLTETHSTPSIKDVEDLLATNVVKLKEKISSYEKLREYIQFENKISLKLLVLKLNEAQDIALKYIASYKQESETNNRIKDLTKNIAIEQEKVSNLERSIKNLGATRNSLGELLKGENSLESIKNKLLKQNARVISEVFSKIHSPCEYKIHVAENEIKLIEESTGNAKTLREVSTGQRAAFALSLFLTMNITLNTGPKVILLDDPISHVDDVNMLSFLDYLRELAITGDRQIFFATPNTKLANLFKHKFKFLGEGQFREIKMIRS